MPQLIVMMGPVEPTQIYRVIDNNTMELEKIFKLPQESISFINDFAKSQNEEIIVSFLGPETYVNHFIEEANKFKFVKASSIVPGGMRHVKVSN